MATLAELRGQLTAKGYNLTSSTADDLTFAPLITVHTHPLLNSPIVLIGSDESTALPYQEASVTEGIKRR